MLLTGRERIKTLDLAAAPTAIELYFFLQAWFQATPQGLFQTYLFLKHTHVNQTNQSGKSIVFNLHNINQILNEKTHLNPSRYSANFVHPDVHCNNCNSDDIFPKI